MLDKLQKLAIATAGLGLSFSLINLDSARAATVTYSVEGTVMTGELIGESYSGSFNYDDSSLTEMGDEFLPISDLSFTFLSETFTVGDASVPPEAIFFDGEFLGVEYEVVVNNPAFPVADFALTTGFGISEAAFTYTPRVGAAGAGDLIYTQAASATVPESSPVFGLLIFGFFGAGYFLKKSKFYYTLHD